MSKKTLPIPKGSFAVGTKTFTVYEDREETLYCAPGTMRSISARVYYPADAQCIKGLAKAQSMSRNMLKAISRNMHIPLNYDKLTKKGANTSCCYENATATAGQKFPLVLYNHGYGAYRDCNSLLLIDLASRGYVVISIAHPYEEMLTELDDGRTIEMAKGIAKKCYSPYFKSVKALKSLLKASGSNEELYRRFDSMQRTYNSFLIDRVSEWEKDNLAILRYAKQELSDIIDLTRGAGVTGHSFGGAVAFALCEDYPELFSCGINMDGGLFGEHEGKVTKTPFMQITSESNANAVTRGFIYHTAPAYHAVFKDMEHLGFTDMKYQIPLKSMVGKLDCDIAHDRLSDLHGEFFAYYLKGVKESPALKSDEWVRVSEFAPDM